MLNYTSLRVLNDVKIASHYERASLLYHFQEESYENLKNLILSYENKNVAKNIPRI